MLPIDIRQRRRDSPEHAFRLFDDLEICVLTQVSLLQHYLRVGRDGGGGEVGAVDARLRRTGRRADNAETARQLLGLTGIGQQAVGL